jgi:hypothetical protein
VDEFFWALGVWTDFVYDGGFLFMSVFGLMSV